MNHKIGQRLGIQAIHSGACDGIWAANLSGRELVSVNPATGKIIAIVLQTGNNNYERVIRSAQETFGT